MGSSVSTGPTSDSSSTFSSAAENSTEENEMTPEQRHKMFMELRQRMRGSSPRPPVAPPPPPRRSISSVPSTPSSASAHTPRTRSQSLDQKSQSTAPQNQTDGKC